MGPASQFARALAYQTRRCRIIPFVRTQTVIEQPPPGVLFGWRARASRRKRRRLAASLRRAARSGSTTSRRTVLLQDRAAAVSEELLEIALMLEHADDLDASSVLAVHRLLTDGCASPLYNRDVHISELRATLYYVRRGRRVHAEIL
jgi:hypothetical protein